MTRIKHISEFIFSSISINNVRIFQEQMMKLETLAKSGARIQPQKDGSVMFRTTETSAPVPSGPATLQPQLPNHPQLQVRIRFSNDLSFS